MQKNPKVSIITTTYNDESFIEECIKSALRQTYENWEQIIVDDNSTDETAKIARKYSERYSRINLLTNETNRGIWKLQENYNQALKLSSGKLIAILEGDDKLPENKLETQVKAFNNPNVVLSWGEGIKIDANGRKIRKTRFKNVDWKVMKNQPIGNALNALLLKNIITPAATVMLRKKTLLNIEGFKQPSYCPFVDYPTWMVLSTMGEFVPLQKVMGMHRMHGSNVGRTMLKESTLGGNKLRLNYYKEFKGKIEALRINLREIRAANLYQQSLYFLIREKYNKLPKNLIKAIFLDPKQLRDFIKPAARFLFTGTR
ncbi:MAG: glycosyltransferase family 2 protein [Candidatus Korarchaeota archaeon]|nr:glycosyltransferase family 2 protein [Candidatus Korarchaeota archaeon]NIU82490.1 glycosyltransferase [Candidatus Thorarchaeota archaeon]NIW12976.1 glycosyltransferase [Candidatus Thorarchaeota archaeon]NIW51129.1 glycosyltransferase [Candidatus Korarchaeota archaeon]